MFINTMPLCLHVSTQLPYFVSFFININMTVTHLQMMKKRKALCMEAFRYNVLLSINYISTLINADIVI